MKLKENETIPNSEFFIMEDANPVKKNTFEFFKDKRVVLFGLPGAYTSVCSAKHLPGYVDSHDEYKAKGVDLIVCISVNDPFVMEAWGKSKNVKDNTRFVVTQIKNIKLGSKPGEVYFKDNSECKYYSI